MPGWSHLFTTGSLPAGLALTRVSAGSFLDAAGQLQAAPVDATRFTHGYDSNTGLWVPKGVLLEPQRTNLFLDASDLAGAGWVLSNLTIGGAPGANSIEESGAAGAHRLYQSFAVDEGDLITTWLDVTAGTATVVQLAPSTSHASGLPFVTYDLATGAVSSGGSGVAAAAMIPLGTDTWRCVMVWSADLTGSGGFSVSLVDNNPAAARIPSYASAGRSLTIHRLQTGLGDDHSSFIQTGASQATRARDRLTGALMSVIPAFNDGAGTLAIEADAPLNASGLHTLVSLDDGTADNRLRLACTGAMVLLDITTGGVAQASIAVARAAGFKAAMRWASDDIQLCVNGALGMADTNGSVPTGLTTLRLGSGVSAGDELGGTVARLSYWPEARSDAHLQGATA